MLKQFLLTLWNVYAFHVTYANADEFDPAEAPEVPVDERPPLDRWVLSQLAQTVAAVVQPHLVWEAAARPHLKDVVEELAQLARLRAQPGDAGISGQQRFEVVPHHAGAASGWAHHVLVRGEHVQHLPGERARVVEEPGIRHRLAAARLPLGEPHRDAIPLEQLRRGKADARVELVDVARDEEGDLHRASL